MGGAICSRCGQDLSANGDAFLGIVREVCFNFLFSNGDGKLDECLDGLDRPAAILARNHAVLRCNDLLRGSAAVEAGEARIGDVLGCMNAALLGRCGETVACFLCGVRKSIEHTQDTGERLLRQPANIQQRSGANREFSLTTEKVGAAVLLIFEAPSDEPRVDL